MNIYHLRKYVLRVTNINFRQTLTCINNKEKKFMGICKLSPRWKYIHFSTTSFKEILENLNVDTGASKIFFHKKSSVLVLQPSEIPFFICTASEKVCQWKERRVYWPEALPVGAESFPHIMLRLDENSEVTVLLPRCSQNPLQVSSLILGFHHFK